MNDDSKDIVAGGPFLHKTHLNKVGFISKLNKYVVLKHKLSVPQQFG